MAATFLAASCAPADKAVGVWEGDRKLAVEPGQDSSIAATLSWVKLEILPDMRFTLLDFGIPKEGRFYEKGAALTLVVDTIMNRRLGDNPDLQKAHKLPLEFRVEGNRGTFFDPNNPAAGKVMLKRESQR